MKNQKTIFMGIDVSKKTLDFCVYDSQQNKNYSIKNNEKEIKKLLKKHLDCSSSLVIGVENTGRYNWPLYQAVMDLDTKLYVISPLHLKRSLGLVRGKNDKIDAERIMEFIKRYYGELTPWSAPRPQIQKLKVLLTERKSRIKMKRQLLASQKEYYLMKNIEIEKPLMKLNSKLLKSLDHQIKELEEKIEELISQDEQLNNKAKLMQSVPGVGKILCWVILAKTNEFKTIDNPRKMACYSGVVPFENQSGTSLLKKPRVSFLADKESKSLLHLGAMSAIRLDNDLRAYYQRKVNEGKNKMSVLNAIRNKIIHRVFAVVRNQVPYETKMNYSI
jgi:transposase